MMEFIDLKTQYQHIKDDIDAGIQRVLDHGKFILGPEVTELQDQLAAFAGVKHAIAVSSGTDSLLLALMALGVGRDDEVVTTPFSFIGTVEVIALLGAKPIFVDIDPGTYNIDPQAIDSAITPKTKAIMPVSLYGQCSDIDAINAIAEKHNLPVIEDAAQSFGATYKGRRSCSLTTIGCTSFFPSKPLGGYGDGGACFTNDDALAVRLDQLHVHGQTARYRHASVGINGRLDTIQAAILLSKLRLFPEEINQRQRIAQRYTRALGDQFVTPHIAEHHESVYAQYTLRVKNRDAIQAHLKEQGIPTAVHYPIPFHLQPVFAYLGLGEGSFPQAELAAKEVMSLPMHPYLGEEEQDEIINALKRFV